MEGLLNDVALCSSSKLPDVQHPPPPATRLLEVKALLSAVVEALIVVLDAADGDSDVELDGDELEEAEPCEDEEGQGQLWLPGTLIAAGGTEDDEGDREIAG